MESDGMYLSTAQSAYKKDRLPKRVGQHTKDYIERWFESLGQPAYVPMHDKTALLDKLKEIDPGGGVTLRHLNAWLTNARRSNKNRSKHNEMEIAFSTLTEEEIGLLDTLTNVTPNPSGDVIAVWLESPVLPNVMIDDVYRFIKYKHSMGFSSLRGLASSNYPMHPNGVFTGNAVQIEEDYPSDGRSALKNSHLPTPASPTPEPHTFMKRESPISPTVYSSNQEFNRVPAPPSEAQSRLYNNGIPDLLPRPDYSLNRPTLNHIITPARSDRPGLSKAEWPNTQGLQWKACMPADGLRTPVSPSCAGVNPFLHNFPARSAQMHTARLNNLQQGSTNRADAAVNPSQGLHVSATRMTGIPVPDSPASPNITFEKVYKDLSNALQNCLVDGTPPIAPLQRLDQCQKQSEELMAAIERGDLKNFHLTPRKDFNTPQNSPAAQGILR